MAFNKLFNYKDPQLDEELRRLIQELALQPAWIAPTLLNSWVNYGSGTNPAGYYKDQFGVVHIRGFVKDGASAVAIFTLPVGYRPTNTEQFVCVANDAIARVDITDTGLVRQQLGSNAWLSLDGISFRTV